MDTNYASIQKLREQFLKSLDDTRVRTDILEQLGESIAQMPGGLVPHVVDSITRAIDTDKVSWNPDYFSRQRGFAARNFSRERLEHLIQVRALFRQRNETGFAPTVDSSSKELGNHTMANYEPSSNLMKFVEEGDLLTTRTALRLELNDRRLDDTALRATLVWIKSAVPGILETYTEGAFARELSASIDQWNEDYYDLQVTYLKTNFSEERFSHLIEVRQHLRESGVKGFTPTPSPASSTSANGRSVPQVRQAPNSGSHQPRSSTATERTNPAFKAALLIGGAIAAVVVFLVALVR